MEITSEEYIAACKARDEAQSIIDKFILQLHSYSMGSVTAIGDDVSLSHIMASIYTDEFRDTITTVNPQEVASKS